MRRILLSVLTVLFTLAGIAQCTPNPLYQDSIFGVWPDTITDLAPGIAGAFYTDTMNLIVPLDAGEIDPLFAGFTIDSVQLASVNGLPPGITVNCNSQTPAPCTMLPSTLGCVLIEGTPTQAGSFPIIVAVTGYTVLITPIPIPYQFEGYEINIDPVGIAEIRMSELGNLKNVPNPFNSETDIMFTMGNASKVDVHVFDLLGQEVWKTSINGKRGQNKVVFDGSSFEQGVYLYQVRAGTSMLTGRMVLDR